MPRGYALGRCWVARPNALCETCRWFVEDTQPDGPALLNLVGLKALLPTEMVVELTGRGTETAEVVYVCELAENVQDSVMIDDDVDDDECTGFDGGDSFDADGAVADAAAAASAATAPVVAEEQGPRRGGRERREVRRD